MHDLYVPGADHQAGTDHARQHQQRGQTLVIVAIMLVVLVGFLGLVVDGGNVYAQRRQMQNAADAAALAGARAMAVDGHSAVEGAAAEYAQMNGATACTVITTSTTVRAVVSKTVSTYFVRVLGITGIPVGAHAKATISPPDTVGCLLLPITVDADSLSPDLKTGDVFTIWEVDPSDCKTQQEGPNDVSSEMHGWLNLDMSQDCNASGADASKCWVCPWESKKDCPLYPISTGDWVLGEPGVKASVLNKMNSETCALNKPALIPLYDDMCECKTKQVDTAGVQDCKNVIVNGKPLTCPCMARYHIIGFASVIVRAVEPGTKCKSITVEWTKFVSKNECAEDTGHEESNAWKVFLVE